MATAGTPPVPPPDGDILAALCLGWAVAEFRGRYYRLAHPTAPAHVPPNHATRTDNALPLGEERSVKERAIEIERITYALAGGMGLDVQCRPLRSTPLPRRVSIFLPTLTETFVAKKSTRHDLATAWPLFTEFLYTWDATIQDALAAKTFGQSSAYQLGRGLAETYWALEPRSDSKSVDGWEFLLGPDRQRILATLLTRLTAFFNPVTAHAIGAALTAWGDIAADDQLRKHSSTEDALRQQVDLWRDLMLTGRDPTSLIPPGRALASARSIWPVLKAFWGQIALTIVGCRTAESLRLRVPGPDLWVASTRPGSEIVGFAEAERLRELFSVCSVEDAAHGSTRPNAVRRHRHSWAHRETRHQLRTPRVSAEDVGCATTIWLRPGRIPAVDGFARLASLGR